MGQSIEESLRMRRMKILLVVPNMQTGGVQTALVNLLHFVESHYDITLFVLNPVGPNLVEVPQSVEVVHGKGLISLLGMSKSDAKSVGNFQYGVRCVAALLTKLGLPMVRIFAKLAPMLGDYDVAISYVHPSSKGHFNGGTAEIVLSRSEAALKAVYVHCDYSSYPMDRSRTSALFDDFNIIVGCSQSCANVVQRVFPEHIEKVRYFHNIVSKPKVRSKAPESPSGKSGANECTFPDTTKLVCVSRLSVEKRVDRAIKVLADLVQKSSGSYSLDILGDGPDRTALIALANELGVADKVRFRGVVSDTIDKLSAYDLLLHTSDEDAAPMVYGEAANAGIPVVTTNTCSARELVEQRNNGIVCDMSVKELSKAVEIVMERVSVNQFFVQHQEPSLDEFELVFDVGISSR